MEDNEHSDPTPQMILPLKTFMVKQNLGSWFLDMSPPSPQVAGLLNKANFPFQLTLGSQVLAFKQQAAEAEFGNIGRVNLNFSIKSTFVVHGKYSVRPCWRLEGWEGSNIC